ncbi:putative signal transduction protein with EAL and GGDEF domain [Novosphingobium chloroacetimidivorans]|uniref:Putative signal transduction protein with EAL and GGDEF domain n=1 Tax=Novosphingobium chloroacetimidivorans TaxID=1428314 RepID=A0A7W7KDP2_9SPHN|nr:hypothetical protein [Novosphingobium chloroacetimidivorans]MBB4860323.1 putative signal transduction protein with EAL and GGDEF domain [Novosphingobium chloroacetimidivorans]
MAAPARCHRIGYRKLASGERDRDTPSLEDQECHRAAFEIKQSIVSISAGIGTIISPDRSISLSDPHQQADAKLDLVKRARKKLAIIGSRLNATVASGRRC